MKIASLRIALSVLGLLAPVATPLATEPVPEKHANPAPAAPGPGAKPLIVTQETAGTFYRDYKRLTEQPRLIAPLTAVYCRTPSKEELDKEKAMAGPHAHVWVHIYANPEAAEAIASKADEFPVGAVIVKEKLGAGGAVTDVGGMIKRAPGYDTANGDWEFFSHTPGGEFTSGKIANCIDCHNNGPRDHVFTAWKLSSR
jgi:hypothetical protein